MPAFPHPVDSIFRALFVTVLLAVVIGLRSRIWVALVLATFAILFLQDQSRLWPSFYQFFFLFLILVTVRNHAGKSDAPRLLAGMRFITAAIYFWSGVQKLNTHFFNDEFPSIVEPLTCLLPFDIPLLPTVGIFAALFELFIGLGLLTKKIPQHRALRCDADAPRDLLLYRTVPRQLEQQRLDVGPGGGSTNLGAFLQSASL